MLRWFISLGAILTLSACTTIPVPPEAEEPVIISSEPEAESPTPQVETPIAEPAPEPEPAPEVTAPPLSLLNAAAPVLLKLIWARS